jgi:hypothetical protein
MKHVAVLAAFCGLAVAGLAAQQPAPPVNQPPKTRLETLDGLTGTVIIRGTSSVGIVRGPDGGSVHVNGQEFTNASTGRTEYGISIDVREASRVEHECTSYIDYDEIDSFLKGLDYLSKVDASATRFDRFQADYRTRGDFLVSTLSSRDGVTVVITSGLFDPATVSLKLVELQAFRELVAQAKAKIDAVRRP